MNCSRAVDLLLGQAEVLQVSGQGERPGVAGACPHGPLTGYVGLMATRGRVEQLVTAAQCGHFLETVTMGVLIDVRV